ncbi:MAG: hypothetical protein ABFS56_20135 [Pseudomonadota bacterium]
MVALKSVQWYRHFRFTALAQWQALAGNAAIIGQVVAELSQLVLVTEFGGERILDELEDEPLPRIC